KATTFGGSAILDVFNCTTLSGKLLMTYAKSSRKFTTLRVAVSTREHPRTLRSVDNQIRQKLCVNKNHQISIRNWPRLLLHADQGPPRWFARRPHVQRLESLGAAASVCLPATGLSPVLWSALGRWLPSADPRS